MIEYGRSCNKSLRFLSILAGIAGTLYLVPAIAEVAETGAVLGPESRILRYMTSRSQLEAMWRAGRRYDAVLNLQPSCTAGNVRPLQVVVESRIDLSDGSAHPASGSWLVRYELSRCGETKRYTIFMNAKGEDQPAQPALYLPGTTLAAPTLIRDANAVGVVSALAKGGAAPTCRRAPISDMTIVEPPHRVVEGDKSYDHVWIERWTYDVCGNAVSLTVTFLQTAADGGTDFRFAVVEGGATH